jgi:deoxyadenosine/deoxycytidine kinase
VADKFIAVAGNIGVGKTTLVQYLGERYGVEPVFEPFAANPYLDDFYTDMDRWAFHSQLWFLAHKYRLHNEVARSPGTFVQDRTIYEDAEIFATYLAQSGRMAARDFATYTELYTAMKRELAPPDLLVYLKCSVKAIRRRIRQRGRANEQDIPLAYLKKLNELYEEWMGRYELSPVLVIDTERLDYIHDLVARIEFHRRVEALL